jgi:hypothetical protein
MKYFIKRPNLELKIQLKHLLGSLSLDISLSSSGLAYKGPIKHK